MDIHPSLSSVNFFNLGWESWLQTSKLILEYPGGKNNFFRTSLRYGNWDFEDFEIYDFEIFKIWDPELWDLKVLRFEGLSLKFWDLGLLNFEFWAFEFEILGLKILKFEMSTAINFLGHNKVLITHIFWGCMSGDNINMYPLYEIYTSESSIYYIH